MPQPSEANRYDDQATKLTAAAHVLHARGEKWLSDHMFGLAAEARADARKARTT